MIISHLTILADLPSQWRMASAIHFGIARVSWSNERTLLKIALLQRFVTVVSEDVHFPRAADRLGIPLASLYSSIDKLEDEVGHPLFVRDKMGMRLTAAGKLLLEEAKAQIAAAPAAAAKPVVPAGGKAKASKGRGRAPKVKRAPKPVKGQPKVKPKKKS
ncbi:LysR family transcriptional regulator (plasmid) [Coraliomargarita sp. W4R53]